MSDTHELSDRIEELLIDWEEQWMATGIDPDVTALCADAPELADELRSAVDSLKQTGWMMDFSIEASDDTLSLPQRRKSDMSSDTQLPDELPTIADFMASLSSSGLLPGDELEQERDNIGSDDARGLAESLIRQERLTPFQVHVLCGLKNGTPLVLGDYVLLDELGEGGMGKVYRARHRRLDTVVALKVMSTSVLDNVDAVRRFEREARVAASLDHRHIVRVQDAREEAGLQLLVMELVEGENLSQMVRRRGPLTVGEAIACLRQAAEGLQHAHEHRVIHRDIKPSNILVDAHGRVKILDMGLARPQVEGRAGDITRPELTSTGHVMGTIDFMAPEQGEDARAADERSDIYSLGCTLHFLLTGSSVYRGTTPVKRLLAHHKEPVPSLRTLRPDVPESLDAAFQKMLAKDPVDRFASMAELLRLLPAIMDEFASGPETSPAPVTSPVSAVTGDTSVAGSLEATVLVKPDSGRQENVDRAQPEEAAARPQQPGTSMTRRLVSVAVLLIAGFVGLYASGIIFNIRTPGGTLILECDPTLLAGANITVDGSTVTLNDPADGKPLTIEVPKDSGELKISKPGFELFAREFSLQHNDGRLAVRLDRDSTAPTQQRIPVVESADDPSSSPADQLRRSNIDRYELTAAGAGNPRSAPKELVGILGDSRLKHWHPIWSLDFTPDGTTLVSVGSDNTIRFWDVESGRQVRRFSGADSLMAQARLTPDGKQLISSAGGNGQSRVWDLTSGNQVSQWHRNGFAIALNPDGTQLVEVSDTDSGAVRVVRIPSGKIVWQNDGHDASARSVAWSADGKWIASGAIDDTVRIWDATNGKEERVLDATGVGGVAISPDSKLVAAVGPGASAIHVWDIQTGELKASLSQVDANGGDPSCCFSKDGQLLLVGFTVFSTSDWSPVHALPRCSTDAIAHAGAISPDSRLIVSAGAAGTIRMVDASDWQSVIRDRPLNDCWTGFDLSPDGGTMATVSAAGLLTLWDTSTAKMIREITATDGEIHSAVQFSPDGRLVACGTESRMNIFDTETGELIHQESAFTCGNKVTGIAFLENDVLTVDHNRVLTRWNLQGDRLSQVKEFGDSVIRLGPDHEFVMVGSHFPHRCFRIGDSKPLWEKTVYSYRYVGPTIHPILPLGAIQRKNDAGKYVAEVVQLEDGKVIRTFEHGDQDYVGGMSFSPDGKTLTTSYAGVIHFWKLNAGIGEKALQRRITLNEGGGLIRDLRYSPDGRHLYTLNGNGTVYVLRLGGDVDAPEWINELPAEPKNH